MKITKKQKTRKTVKPTPAFDSMESAAGGMAHRGITLKILEVSKAMGAPGFRGSRIYPDEFLPWFEANKTAVLAESSKLESKDEADARVARARANRMEFELEVRKRNFIAIADVSQTFTRCCVAVKSKMLAIPSSLAPRLALMTSPEEIATLIKSEVIAALTELSKSKWNKAKP